MNYMNRIIIIGNGFDLAHGLPTLYKDFISAFWKDFSKQIQTCNDYKLETELVSFGYMNITPELQMYSRGIANDLIHNYGFLGEVSSAQKIEDFISGGGSQSMKLIFNSKLFENINKAVDRYNWVDIEEEYYKLLHTTYITSSQKLNNDFAIIRSKLIDYLTSVQNVNIDNSIVNEVTRKYMMAPFCAKEISIEGRDKWVNFLKSRIEDEDLSGIIKLYEKSDVRERVADIASFKKKWQDQIDNDGIETVNEELPSDMLYPDRIMLLNFNYTKAADMYMPADKHHFPVNHIHGHLENRDSIIFGYGDDKDDKYQEISKLNNNELLTNIKTFRYLEYSYFKDTLTFIASAPYQVYIMGHSCGASDRTLLNTLFEHPNCVSIKPFYYKNGEGQDNYIEIVQNISRNFSDAQKMRDRVVNKTLCQPLPQRIVSNK